MTAELPLCERVPVPQPLPWPDTAWATARGRWANTTPEHPGLERRGLTTAPGAHRLPVPAAPARARCRTALMRISALREELSLYGQPREPGFRLNHSTPSGRSYQYEAGECGRGSPDSH
ncbi:hypothetical protein GCM10018772_05550 [Streptomyces fumanus]|uniref:Uncharacterized protein n=1 Tax=Streptomyces fumanus TaxID=67302 RepID=A0A919A3W3_9ACTN|nr:hypothetical protein GCM10018772_05550 [Streptomyces fumanus]